MANRGGIAVVLGLSLVLLCAALPEVEVKKTEIPDLIKTSLGDAKSDTTKAAWYRLCAANKKMVAESIKAMIDKPETRLDALKVWSFCSLPLPSSTLDVASTREELDLSYDIGSKRNAHAAWLVERWLKAEQAEKSIISNHLQYAALGVKELEKLFKEMDNQPEQVARILSGQLVIDPKTPDQVKKDFKKHLALQKKFLDGIEVKSGIDLINDGYWTADCSWRYGRSMRIPADKVVQAKSFPDVGNMGSKKVTMRIWVPKDADGVIVGVVAGTRNGVKIADGKWVAVASERNTSAPVKFDDWNVLQFDLGDISTRDEFRRTVSVKANNQPVIAGTFVYQVKEPFNGLEVRGGTKGCYASGLQLE